MCCLGARNVWLAKVCPTSYIKSYRLLVRLFGSSAGAASCRQRLRLWRRASGQLGMIIAARRRRQQLRKRKQLHNLGLPHLICALGRFSLLSLSISGRSKLELKLEPHSPEPRIARSVAAASVRRYARVGLGLAQTTLASLLLILLLLFAGSSSSVFVSWSCLAASLLCRCPLGRQLVSLVCRLASAGSAFVCRASSCRRPLELLIVVYLISRAPSRARVRPPSSARARRLAASWAASGERRAAIGEKKRRELRGREKGRASRAPTEANEAATGG